jgi:hypothetical protein
MCGMHNMLLSSGVSLQLAHLGTLPSSGLKILALEQHASLHLGQHGTGASSSVAQKTAARYLVYKGLLLMPVPGEHLCVW